MMQHFKYEQTFEQNKNTYRRLVKLTHPDKGGSKEQFLRIQAEWEEYQKNYEKNINGGSNQALKNELEFLKKQRDERLDNLQKELEKKLQEIRLKQQAELLEHTKELEKLLKKEGEKFATTLGNKLAKSILNLFK